MFSYDRSELQKKIVDSDKINRAVILRIEETLYHLISLEKIGRELFIEELDCNQLSSMKAKLLTLLREARSN